MLRLRAAALAIIFTLATFALAVAAAVWLFGADTFWGALSARWFPVALIIFNSLVISLMVIFMIVRAKRAERIAEEERSDLQAASERLRQQLKRRSW